MWNYLSSSAIMSFFTLLPKKKKPAAAFVIPVSAFYLLEQNCDHEPSVGLNEDKDRTLLHNLSHPPASPCSYHLCTRRDTTSRVLLFSGGCWGHKLAKHEESRHDTLRKTSPKLENTLVAHSCWPKIRQSFMHLFTKVRAVNVNSPVFFFVLFLFSFFQMMKAGQQKASPVVRSHRTPPLVPAGFKLHLLCEAAPRRAPRAASVARCGWARTRRKQRTEKGRGEGGSEDDGTGVEFTHPTTVAYFGSPRLGDSLSPRGGEGERGWSALWKCKCDCL